MGKRDNRRGNRVRLDGVEMWATDAVKALGIVKPAAFAARRHKGWPLLPAMVAPRRTLVFKASVTSYPELARLVVIGSDAPSKYEPRNHVAIDIAKRIGLTTQAVRARIRAGATEAELVLSRVEYKAAREKRKAAGR